ncbi:MAG: hypothetical protein NTZ56_19925 [Acidobacteria bacterium]|nr:hypothetical protein [Acidobacteriota bacterium]
MSHHKHDLLAASKEQPFLSASAGTSVSIGIQGVPTAQGAIVSYITLPANTPKTYGNHIYVWQTTANAVPWAKSPDGDTAINTDSSQSTTLVTFPFEQKGYIVGYAVAPTPQAVVSTVYMPADQQDNPAVWEYAAVGIAVVYYGNNLVQVQYTGLPQYSPATNKNWIGIWQGSQVPYSGDPIKRVDVTQDAPSSGYAVIEGIKLLIGVSYCVGYFSVEPVKGRTSLAASATFTVGS